MTRSRSLLLLLILLIHAGAANAQTRDQFVRLFSSAGSEFGIPPAVLQGIAFVESRWTQLLPDTLDRDAEARMPHAYGVMAMRDDDWFGHSLLNAAALLGVDSRALRENPAENIRGAAALLADIARRMKLPVTPDHPAGWAPAIAAYSGIPQPDIAADYALSVFQVLVDGYLDDRIMIERVPVDSREVEQILRQSLIGGMPLGTQSQDYPPAVWDPSPNFNSRGGSPITHVIVHDTEGSFAGSVSWLKDPVAQVSSHYVIRSYDGYMKQLVREADRAWHVGCWNSWTLGIEHEGYVNQPSYFTPQMYQSSAALVRHFCDTYGIPKDRLHIVGHNIWQDPVLFSQLNWDNCNTHTDPGPYWNWNYYLSLIVADSTPPAVVSHYPHPASTTVPIYTNVRMTFDRPMDIVATQNAFSISPTATGGFQWSVDGKTMTYKPAAYLQTSTQYSVTLSTGARGSGGGTLPQQFHFSFTTLPPDTTGPQIVRVYPRDGLVDVDPFMAFEIRFDEGAVFSSLAGRVSIVDDSLKPIPITNAVYTDLDDGSMVTFAPRDSLQRGRAYRLSVLPGIKDVFGNSSSETRIVDFRSRSVPEPAGVVIDPFEDNRYQWQDPARSSDSRSIDTAATHFSIVSTKKRGGGCSGQLTYSFTGSSGGSCAVTSMSGVALDPTSNWLGVYVFGDNSNNRLELQFETAAGGMTVPVDTLNWYGWSFVSLQLSNLPRNVVSLQSLVLRQLPGGDQIGTLNVDNLEADRKVVDSVTPTPVRSFVLYQNYPNPFNPTTTIFFELDRSDNASLEVFTPLGQRVATLLDRPMAAGRYSIQFDGKSLPSGVYIYRLRTGNGSQLKKMLLIK
jgi:N-acetyl-anhydromuramyl-L-alanine amidase AmpD